MRTINATVRGVVQGVGFRYWTSKEAERLGIVGWVRNKPDGSVEVLAQGNPVAVDAMIRFLESGPRHARVASVETSEVPPEPEMISFEIDY